MIEPIRWGDRMLHFGDPLDCDYPWIAPARLDDHATSVGQVGRKVDGAAEALDVLDRLDDDGAGAAVDAMREDGVRLRGELVRARGNVRGVAAAVRGYAAALREYREDLGDVRAHAVGKGLDVRGDRVLAPVTTPPAAGSPAAGRWEEDWQTYATCFEWLRRARARRREALQEMTAALLEHAGVRPRTETEKRGPTGRAGRVDHRDDSGAAGPDDLRRLRREAAQEAAAAIRAETEAQDAHRRHQEARAALAGAVEELAALRRDGADTAAVDAKRAEVAQLAEQARESGGDAQDRAAAAERQRERAHDAARDHDEARDRRAGGEGAGREGATR